MSLTFASEGKVADQIREYLEYLDVVPEIAQILNNEDLDLYENDSDISVRLSTTEDGLKVTISLVFSIEDSD